MGYYTNFNLTMLPEPDINFGTEIMKAIAAKIDNKDPNDISDYDAEWCLGDSLKWYDHDKDMIEVSKQFPDITFILDGEGEDNDDIWKAYYKNGEMEVIQARIVFDEPVNPIFIGLEEN